MLNDPIDDSMKDQSGLSGHKSDPNRRLEILERWSGRATLLILAGILVDILVASLSSKSKVEFLAAISANSLIGLGLVIEYFVIARTIVASGEAKRLSDEKIAAANARAAEAQLELAKLEKKITPRVITDEHAQAIIDKIKPFFETPFSIEADPAAEYAFITRLIAVLQRAHWKWVGYPDSYRTLPLGDVGIDESAMSGIQVRINKSRLDDFKEPAEALSFALTEALGASVPLVVDPPESRRACSPDLVHIEIQRKL
jgi:hypothetical protein